MHLIKVLSVLVAKLIQHSYEYLIVQIEIWIQIFKMSLKFKFRLMSLYKICLSKSHTLFFMSFSLESLQFLIVTYDHFLQHVWTVHVMRVRCYQSKGWWTYEFCYGREIKQYHMEGVIFWILCLCAFMLLWATIAVVITKASQWAYSC